MTRNPFLNAITAALYIIIITLIMDYGTKHIPHPNSFMAPIAIVSFFTLSAAVMAYVFGYQPLLLFIDGKKKEAVNLFLKTVAVFAGITAVILLLFFSGIIK